jgi:hypothetical protein
VKVQVACASFDACLQETVNLNSRHNSILSYCRPRAVTGGRRRPSTLIIRLNR